ncbi:hypothetical protein [Bacillus manliponensis]
MVEEWVPPCAVAGQGLFLPCAMLQQMDEMSTFIILIYVAATFV